MSPTPLLSDVARVGVACRPYKLAVPLHARAAGLLDGYDAPLSLPCIAPRPLLITNGGEDPRCPVAGLTAALPALEAAYQQAGLPSNLSVFLDPGVGHKQTAAMSRVIRAWFDQHLLKQKGPGEAGAIAGRGGVYERSVRGGGGGGGGAGGGHLQARLGGRVRCLAAGGLAVVAVAVVVAVKKKSHPIMP